MESVLEKEIRQRFAFFGSICLLLAAAFTLCFYKAGIGISFIVYVVLATVLIHKAAIKIRKITFEHTLQESSGTWDATLQPTDQHSAERLPVILEQAPVRFGYFYEAAALLLAVSNFLTASVFLHVFSTLGIILLLEANFLNMVLPERSKTKNDLLQFFNLVLLPLVSVAQIAFPFLDAGHYLQKKKLFKNEKVRQILLGLLLSIPLLLIVIALLANADLIFNDITSSLTKHIFLSADPFLIPLLTLFIFLFCYCIICAAGFMIEKNFVTPTLNVKNQLITTAITVVSCLTVVYLIFCGIQIVYLFFKTGLVDGYTYSEYARRGFFELLAVVILNLFVILICRKAAEQSKPLRISLLIMACCTYIMIASAAYRMILYIQAYHLTLLRFLVLWFLAVILLWITGAIFSVFKAHFSLVQYLTLVITVLYLLLAFARPDYWIAKYNVTFDDSFNYEDIQYLTSLSADAASVLVHLDEKSDLFDEKSDPWYSAYSFSDYIEDYANRIKSSYRACDFRDWNISLYNAYSAFQVE